MGRNLNLKHELPANPTFKAFERSDGTPSQWPKNTERVVDGDGHVNYMEYLDLNHPVSINWRTGVAKAVAKACDWPAGHAYVLADWPTDYRLYCHQKGPQADPRRDIYLFGSKATAKFRSINEFIPHARWLFDGATGNCECKYCSKKSQREITANMGNEGIIEAPSYAASQVSASPAAPRRPPRPPRDQNLHATVQKAPKPITRSNHIAPQHAMVTDRNSDVRAVHSRTSMKLKRWCRHDEVVWCALRTPIPGPNGTSIRFWPGMIENANVKQITKNKPNVEDYQASSSTSNGDDPPWEITQYTIYTVRLLAATCSWRVDDGQVLPYQAYHLPSYLLQTIRSLPPTALDTNREALSQFNPCPEMTTAASTSALSRVTFEQAAGPFVLAVQIAAQITQHWGLTDTWDFKYAIPQSSSSSSSQAQPGPSAPSTLQDAISSASATNAAAMNPRAAPSQPQLPRNPYEADISASRPASPATLNRLANDVLGVPNPLNPETGPTHTITQTRCQGLWWGPERIWVDDWVRIKLPRKALAPNGAPHILAPAKPSKKARESFKASDLPESAAEKTLGAQNRAVFMRLDALFIVETPVYSDDGSRVKTKKECRASGMLYELADVDWEESDQGGVGANGVGSTPVSKPSSSSSFGAPNTELLQNTSEAIRTSPQLSPLKPTALPNPDPAVPIEATSSNMLSQQGLPSTPLRTRAGGSDTTPPRSQGSDTLSKSGDLSRPSSDTFLMPEPPEGYKFRPILDEGYEAVFSLTMISGRYYPKILEHPLLQEMIADAAAAMFRPIPEDAPDGSMAKEGAKKYDVLWALEGISAGYMNSVDPASYRVTRKKMVEDADKEARGELEEYKRTKFDDDMEVDEPRPPVAVADRPIHQPMEVDVSA
ncbi:hypothetical protein V5O48_006788 [Marasmius crinis-equi]|uniref:Cryptic loci regulator 2 N-terminal domain-containing protein n=1 Tax=Marasmius crinis-equi TaxID=585013 RepID=A0ABR3FIM0_9AGAR